MSSRLRRTGAALVITVAALGAGTPSVAASYNSGCVTRSEYRRVHDGDSMGRVHRLFGSTGKKVAEYSGYGYASQTRQYRVCSSSWGLVMVNYDREYGTWRLSYKSAYWA
jgi:hypothetical protein